MLTWLEISKKNLLNNLYQFKKLYPGFEIIPVIKANAYGCGFEIIADVLKDEVGIISVASIKEALRLRRILPDHRIVVLSIIEKSLIEKALEKNIELSLCSNYWFEEMLEVAINSSKKALIHVKVDTGTHRLGFDSDEVKGIVSKIEKSQRMELKGVFSHYAASEEIESFTKKQTSLFESTIKPLDLDEGVLFHMACSAASLIKEGTGVTNAIRLGVSLYGYWPSKKTKEEASRDVLLKPVLSWKTRIIHLKEILEGECIGYGCTYEVKKKSLIATLPLGYSDGFDRKLGNKGEVLVGGMRCSIVGRVCMNLTMIDVTKVANVQVRDEVVILGRQEGEEITVEETAEKVGTINYEIISRISSDIDRIVV